MSIWDFVGFVMIVGLCTVQSRAGSFQRILVALPSTIMHESCHALAATVTGGRVTFFSVFPRRRIVDTPLGKRRIWVLGQVSAEVGTTSAAPTSLAPLILLYPAYHIFMNWPQYFSVSGPGVLYAYGLIYIFIFGSIPSSADIRILFVQPKSTVFYASLSAILYFWWDGFVRAAEYLASFISTPF